MPERTEVTLFVRYLNARDQWIVKDVEMSWRGTEPNLDETAIESSYSKLVDSALGECDSPVKFVMSFTVISYNSKGTTEQEESGEVSLSGDSNLWVECISSLSEAFANEVMQYL